MITVAHVMYGLRIGGLEQLVLDLCRFRTAGQFHCMVAAREGGIFSAEFEAAGVPVLTGPGAFAAAADAADILNVHVTGNDLPLLRPVRAANKPFVVTLHAAAPLRPPGAPVIVTSRHISKLQPDPSACVVIRNGVDTERFACERPRRAETGDEVIRIVQVCRPPKSSLFFWAALSEVLCRYPNCRLWIVGNPAGAGESTAQIRFLGPRRDIPEIMAHCDLFAYAPYPEGGSMDLVVMEASASGLPIVATDVPSVREAVFDGQNGFLTRFGDTRAFVGRLEQLIKDHLLRERMSRAGAELAQKEFDVRAVSRRYEEVYQSLLLAMDGALHTSQL